MDIDTHISSPQDVKLSRESLGLLNYLHNALSQPEGSWNGFYTPQSPSMNFALRYQLAFSAYAVAALSQKTPAYRAPYTEALRGAIQKMLDIASWGYWYAPSPNNANAASSGHIAALANPHNRAPAGPPSDPIARDNLQYSGHLSTMLGLYEKLSGDEQYDYPFTLHDPRSGVAYTYTHSEVAARIHAQMRENRFGGVCCESGMAYVPCNNHALASNALHDDMHGTSYREANARWLRSVRDKMVLKGPALRGVFGAAYVKDLGMAAPVAFNFTDAWGLAFMLPFDRPLVRKLYPKFHRRVTREGPDAAYLSSSPLSEKMEISDAPINTGFALIAARGMGDSKLATALHRHSSNAFGAAWQGTHYLYKDAPRTLHATALYALADAVDLGGENFYALFNTLPDRSTLTQPSLVHVSAPDGSVGVSEAAFDPPTRTLRIGLRQLGDLTALRESAPKEITLTLDNITARPHIEVDGSPLDGAYTHSPDGRLRFSLILDPIQETSCVAQLT